MALNYGGIEEFTFSDQDNLAGACAGALRKVKSLADIVPAGRLFASISTLSETAAAADDCMAAGALRAAARKLAEYGEPASVTDLSAPLPINVRKRG